MRIHILQHVPFEDPGYLKDWAHRHGHSVFINRLFEAILLPPMELFDMLVILGGPMGANETQRYPWLKVEMELIENAISKKKKVLGICLGAQLVSRVLGGNVYQNPLKEIGWHPVRLTFPARRLSLFEKSPSTWTAFHWHKDTFSIPPMGFRFVESDACPNQGYLYEDHVMALQFHLESSQESVEALIKTNHMDIELGSFIQDKEEIHAGCALHMKSMHRLLGAWLNAWLHLSENA